MKEFDFEKTPIVEIANEILLDGVKRGASDIHFDPYKDGLAIRMRVDGVLYDYSSVPANYKRNMISRIKMIASMNIMETRLPQDGAIKSKIGDKTLDLRVSSLPTHNGEKVVLRILDYSKSLQGLETLGFSAHNLDKIIKMIEIPNGIVLVTGATGSGKSTTVYSILQKLNTREVNIITVEDPVEMEVEGLNQVQAQQEIGLDFATVLRSILRQDPDIIMIGEIRDTETARIAVRASITGHKVLSTIHTNNALNTIERLTDMDVERYLIGTSLNGIISQKLARKLCPHCRIARETNEYEKNLFKTVLHKDVDKVYEVNTEGCEHCFKGYKGRIAIAEVLVITDDIRTAITEAEPKEVMRKLVYYDGQTHTLLEDGLEKIELGETNFEEIFKLVDLENDLAVAKSFYDEIEKDMHSDKKDEEIVTDESIKEELNPNEGVQTQEETTISQEEVVTSEPAQIQEVTVPEETTKIQEVVPEDTVASQEVTTQEVETSNEEIPTISVPQETVLTDEDDTNGGDVPVISVPQDQVPVIPLEVLKDDAPKEETEVLETLDQVDTSYKDANTNNIIEIFDAAETDNNQTEEPKEELETFEDIIPNQNIVEEFDNSNTETLDLTPEVKEDAQELTNPIESLETLETFDELDTKKDDENINYDQMVKVPFVDETLDL